MVLLSENKLNEKGVSTVEEMEHAIPHSEKRVYRREGLWRKFLRHVGGYVVSGVRTSVNVLMRGWWSSSKRIVRPMDGGGEISAIGRTLVRVIGDSDMFDDATWDDGTWTENADVSHETQALGLVENGCHRNRNICECSKTVEILDLIVLENRSKHWNVCEEHISNEMNSVYNSNTEFREGITIEIYENQDISTG